MLTDTRGPLEVDHLPLKRMQQTAWGDTAWKQQFKRCLGLLEGDLVTNLSVS